MTWRLLLALLCAPFSFAQLCSSWSGAQTGQLDRTVLNETSGLASSRLVSDRLFVMSDSDSPNFYITSLQGSPLQQVRIGTLGNYARDVEDLAVGPCGSGSCLFVGNIGGNNFERNTVEIILIEELADFPDRVEPRYVLTLAYPDGPHDAEGLAVHPNGDIYVLSKEGVGITGIPAAKLYRARAWPWPTADEPLPLRHIATLDLRALSGSALDLFSHTATALDISADGQRVLVLTYGDAFEFDLDLATLPDDHVTHIGPDTPHSLISVDRLAQQEAIGYLSDMDAFAYSTEARGADSPIRLETCQGR